MSVNSRCINIHKNDDIEILHRFDNFNSRDIATMKKIRNQLKCKKIVSPKINYYL